MLPLLAVGAKTTQIIDYPDLFGNIQTFSLSIEHRPRGYRIVNPEKPAK